MERKRKNIVRITESELKSIITESVKNILKETQENEFSNDCEQLWLAFKDVTGGEDLKEYMFNAMGDLVFGEGDDFKTVWTYNERSMMNLLRGIVNYDLIDIFSEPGTINIENSNHPDIAEIMQKYCTPEMIKRVEETFDY
jgi:hypothetical protein